MYCVKPLLLFYSAGVRSVCVLLPVLGITWLFGILSVNDDLIVFQYLFSVTNSLQVLYICVN